VYVRKAIAIYSVATILLGSALLQPLANAGNTHYRWQDERGNVVHSDRPPPAGIDYDVISTGTSKYREVDAAEGAVPARIKPTPGNEFEPADSKPTEVEKNPEYCQRARTNLEAIETNPRIRMRNDKGEYYFLDQDQIAEQKALAQENIDRFCE